MLVKELLVLRDQKVCNKHQSQMNGWKLGSIVIEIVEMPLKMSLVQPTGLDFDKKVSGKGISEKNVRTPSVDDHLSAD